MNVKISGTYKWADGRTERLGDPCRVLYEGIRDKSDFKNVIKLIKLTHRFKILYGRSCYVPFYAEVASWKPK